MFALLRWGEIYVCGFEFAVAQEFGDDLHTDPIQGGLVRVYAHQTGEQQRVYTLELDQGQHVRRFGEEFLRTEVADSKSVDIGLTVADVDPVGLLAGVHIVAARVGVGVAVHRVLVGQQALIGQPGKPGAVLGVGMQVGDLVGLLYLDGSHLFEEGQRIWVGLFGEGDIVDDETAQGLFTFWGDFSHDLLLTFQDADGYIRASARVAVDRAALGVLNL